MSRHVVRDDLQSSTADEQSRDDGVGGDQKTGLTVLLGSILGLGRSIVPAVSCAVSAVRFLLYRLGRRRV